MIKRKLIKPRKVVWAMRDFINDIHELTYVDLLIPHIENENPKDWLKRFADAEEYEMPKEVKMVKRENGFAVLRDEDEMDERIFHFYYNIDDLYSKGHKQFAQDFFARCPMGRGFASITITILHEIGHKKAQQNFDGYDRRKALDELDKKYSRDTINFAYFKLPDEKAATDWAIEWLNQPENRKKAKQFEKKFFECFAKNY